MARRLGSALQPDLKRLPDRVERLARAKVNLALHVVGRRADGYHDLDTLAVFADFGDRLAVSAAPTTSLSVSGPLAAHAPAGDENLIVKAALALGKRAGGAPGARIELDKHLPAGAGLGGGSADAAAALHVLNEVWGLGVSPEELGALGMRLGADLPMCVAGRALRARGTGERIALLDSWPALPLVLVWPGRPVATAAAFAALEKRDHPPLPEPPPRVASPTEAARWLRHCRNDLEAPAMRLESAIGEALAALRAGGECLLARMSGSGSACFGLYAEAGQAERAAAHLAEARPGWWVKAVSAA